jgi:YidC/Oxa1 family membrane protein insertase
MERRVLVAIFLSFLVLYVYQTYVVKPVPKTAKTTAAGAPSVPGVNAPADTTAGAPAASPAQAQAEAPAAPAAAALVGETSERDITVETRDVIAVFTNRGARLKSWRLKRYLDKEKQPQELIDRDLPTQPLP